MRKPCEITTDILSLGNLIVDNNLKIKELEKGTKCNGNFKDWIKYKKEHSEEIEKINVEIGKLSDQNKIYKLKVHILKNNYTIALFNEVMPAALEVFNKWKNKPYGDKTKEKIKTEIMEKTGTVVYIHKNMFHCIDNRDCNYMSFDCGTKYIDGSRKPILLDNKIQELSMEDLELYYINQNYVENIDKEVETILALHDKALRLKEELENVCVEFNKHTVDGISCISINTNNFNSL